jgi:hypothetical protein
VVQRLKYEEKRFDDWSAVLFDQALLAEGGQLEDPAGLRQAGECPAAGDGRLMQGSTGLPVAPRRCSVVSGFLLGG